MLCWNPKAEVGWIMDDTDRDGYAGCQVFIDKREYDKLKEENRYLEQQLDNLYRDIQTGEV